MASTWTALTIRESLPDQYTTATGVSEKKKRGSRRCTDIKRFAATGFSFFFCACYFVWHQVVETKVSEMNITNNDLKTKK